MDIRFDWLDDETRIDDAARMFAAEVGPSYISHSELQSGRALSPSEWAPDLAVVLREEIAGLVPRDRNSGARVACGFLGSDIVAVAIVSWELTARIPFVVLEDIVVDSKLRGRQVGQNFLDWIFGQARAHGVKRCFLESGKDNHDAHHFFARNGFAQVSIVMMSDLA
ncbi:GNAT family N-acetyltransferase [Tardiphaga sp.]|uniref:GNAT family N-acetyltransferase n=1 Tax=Tardiphaga sp. TaxID=1926292 RepID=UPI0026138C86|nr:GNAT family N-acetyltransferase [Tardiphaga sp.]